MKQEIYGWVSYCSLLLLMSDYARRSQNPIIYLVYAALIVTYMISGVKRHEN